MSRRHAVRTFLLVAAVLSVFVSAQKLPRLSSGGGEAGSAAGKRRFKPISSYIAPDGDASVLANLPTEARLKARLLMNYDPTSRPVFDHDKIVDVNVGLSVYHILDTNEKSQTISLLLGIRLRWTDEYLHWNESEYNIKRIFVPIHMIWAPDLLLNNNADAKFHRTETNAIVKSDGSVLWMFPSVATTYCTLDVRYFPFDVQSCDLGFGDTTVFISWTYSMKQLSLQSDLSLDKHTSYYDQRNQEWRLDNITATRHVRKYVCCPDEFVDVTVTLAIQRRTMFYILNLIFPCFLIYSVSFLAFYLPVESNDKITLEITILLAMIVFLMVILEMLPPTPDAIPLLGKFYGATMILVAIALVLSVAVTNIHYRKFGATYPSDWLRAVFLRDAIIVEWYKTREQAVAASLDVLAPALGVPGRVPGSPPLGDEPNRYSNRQSSPNRRLLRPASALYDLPDLRTQVLHNRLVTGPNTRSGGSSRRLDSINEIEDDNVKPDINVPRQSKIISNGQLVLTNAACTLHHRTDALTSPQSARRLLDSFSDRLTPKSLRKVETKPVSDIGNRLAGQLTDSRTCLTRTLTSPDGGGGVGAATKITCIAGERGVPPLVQFPPDESRPVVLLNGRRHSHTDVRYEGDIVPVSKAPPSTLSIEQLPQFAKFPSIDDTPNSLITPSSSAISPADSIPKGFAPPPSTTTASTILSTEEQETVLRSPKFQPPPKSPKRSANYEDVSSISALVDDVCTCVPEDDDVKTPFPHFFPALDLHYESSSNTLSSLCLDYGSTTLAAAAGSAFGSDYECDTAASAPSSCVRRYRRTPPVEKRPLVETLDVPVTSRHLATISELDVNDETMESRLTPRRRSVTERIEPETVDINDNDSDTKSKREISLRTLALTLLTRCYARLAFTAYRTAVPRPVTRDQAWEILARRLDRVFFWLYFTLSLIVLGAIGCAIPEIRF